MDYTEVCQGWIYCITNKVNGKRYVGKTKNYNSRKSHHFGMGDNRTYIKKAMNHYGRENFEMIPLVHFTAINSEVCNAILNTLEVYYIKKFDTFNRDKGYNLTLGGDGGYGVIVSEETRKKLAASSTGRLYTEETRNKLRENWKEKCSDKLCKPVLLYTLDGRFYREFGSISDAIRYIGRNHDSGGKSVLKALSNEKSKAYGYLWRYKTTNQFPLFIDEYKVERKVKKVFYYSKEGMLIRAFDSIKEAVILSDVLEEAIRGSIKSKVSHHIKNYWSYESPTT